MERMFLAEYLRISLEDRESMSGGKKGRKTESNSILCQREGISQYRRDRQIYPEMPVVEYIEV